MANRLTDSCAAYASAADVLTAGYSGAVGSVVAAGGRFGLGAVRLGSGAGNSLQRAFPVGLASWAVGFVYSPKGAINVGSILRAQEGSTLHVDVRPSATDIVTVTRNGTLLGTGVTQFILGQDYVIQLKFTISDTVGTIDLYVNDNLEISLTGLDTKNGGTGLVDNFVWGGTTNSTAQDVSEVYVNDTTGGAPNNTVWGSYRIVARRVTAAGNYAQFTPLSSTNASNVDEPNGHDGDGSYNSSSTPGNIDSFQFGAVTPASGTVPAIMHRIVVRKDDAGVRTIAPVQRQSGTDVVGTSQTVTTAYAHYTEVKETNPVTGTAWTLTEMRSSTPEFGYKLVA